MVRATMKARPPSRYENLMPPKARLILPVRPGLAFCPEGGGAVALAVAVTVPDARGRGEVEGEAGGEDTGPVPLLSTITT
jgi:hypothetical protein